jgi:hypothetical protein
MDGFSIGVDDGRDVEDERSIIGNDGGDVSARCRGSERDSQDDDA